ncbi:AAA family ATPase [Aeromonas veronii]|uniref:AAA family ATPase n=1 Tax=Aeromonas veronii TaxID=654 RepID=UPI001325C42E|nr:AAA family ATPase [Aeromonas veronii]MXV30995.1 AAA family ATPase [Aeromonas veronii]
MKLIHIYVESYKHLKNINIRLHGGFKCEHVGGVLSIASSPTIDTYYKGSSFQAIIGKNGVGKTSILDLISSDGTDPNQQLFMVWYNDKNEYEIHTRYYAPKDVNADKKYKILHEYLDGNVRIAKINNISEPFSSLNKNMGTVSTLTPSIYKSTKANRRYQNKILSNFFSSSKYYQNELRPKYKITLYKLDDQKLSKIFYNIERDKATHKTLNELLLKKNLNIHDIKNTFISYENDNGISVRNNFILSISSQIAKNNPQLINGSQVQIAAILLAHIFSTHGISLTSIDLWEKEYIDNIDKWSDDVRRSNSFRPEKENTYLTLKNNITAIDNIIVNLSNYDNKNYHNIDEFPDRTTFIHSEPNQIQYIMEGLERSKYHLNDAFEYGWDGLSSGELAKALLLANIFRYIQKTKSVTNHIILMDEIDIYLHPEWQRKIISEIISLISTESVAEKFQFIITSHSPIVISDLLPENIVSLSKRDNGVVFISESPGYATQITDLYLQGLHISSTYGEITNDTLTRLLNKNTRTQDDIDIISRISSNNIRSLLERI